MAQQFLKKKFSFRGLFLRFFAIVILSLSVTVNVYAASPLTSLYENVINQPFPKAKTKVETKNTVVKPKTNIFTSVSSFLDKYYDSYTSGLALVLYPSTGSGPTTPTVSPATPSQKPTGLAVVTTPSTLASLKTLVSPASPQTKIVYIQGPQGPAGPQGPQGPKGDAGLTSFGSTITSSSPNPVAYMPVGITIPNPSQNFTGGEYASIANLTSNLFTNNTSNIITLNVSGNEAITGNSSIGGTFNVTGATTLSGNLNVTGTITGSVTGAMNPALTNGSVFFQDTAGISQDNANFFYDKVNHRLGLGTNAPATILEVSKSNAGALGPEITLTNPGNVTGDAEAITFKSGSYTRSQILSTVATGGGAYSGDLNFLTKDTYAGTLQSRIFIEGYRGYVGIGTTSPATLMELFKSTTPQLRINHTTASSYGEFQFSEGSTVQGGLYGIGSTFATTNRQNNVELYSVYGAVTLNTNNLERVRIQNDGNVGIGTTAPNANLQITSQSATPQNGLFVTTNTFTYGSVGTLMRLGQGASSGNTYSAIDSLITGGTFQGPLVLNQSGGNVGIGTTAPGSALEVSGATPRVLVTGTNNGGNAGYRLTAKASDGTVRNGGLYYVPGTTPATTYLGLAPDNVNSFLVVTSDGNVGIGTTVPDTALTVAAGTGVLNNVVTLSLAAAGGTTSGSGAGVTAIANSVTPGARKTSLYFSTYDQLAGGYTEKVRIQSDGNVGIGTTAPGTRLHVTDGVGTGYPTLGTAKGNLFLASNNSLYGLYEGSVGADGNSWLQVMRNDSAVAYNLILQPVGGNVGIGTTNPTALLDVYNGKIQQSNNNASAFDTYQIYASGGGVDAKYWRTQVLPSTNRLSFQTVNDAYSVANAWLDVYRSGNTVASVNFPNGNVGVGTSSPSNNLSVIGSSGFIAGFGNGTKTLSIYADNTVTTIGTRDATDFRLFSNNVDRLSVTSAGNVGIGTTSPLTLLHLQQSSVGASAARIFLKNSAANTVGNATDLTFGSSSSFTDGTYSGRIQSIVVNAGSLASDMTFGVYNGTSDIEALRILSTGNVGIGTTAPTDKLQVSGNVMANAFNAIGGVAQFNSTGGVYMAGLGGSSYGAIQSYSDAGGTARLLALNPSGGNVGIGTTAPGRPLDVVGAQVSDGSLRAVLGVQSTSNYNGNPAPGIDFIVRYNSSAALAGIAGISGYKVNTTDGDYSGGLQFHTRNNGSSQAEVMRIDNLGNVGIGTTAPATKLEVADGAGNSVQVTASDIRYRYSTDPANTYRYWLMANTLGQGPGSGNEAGLLFNSSDGGQLRAGLATSLGGLAFYTNGTTNTNAAQRMIITASGNVGIGTTAPGAVLHAQSSNFLTAAFQGTSAASRVHFVFPEATNNTFDLRFDTGTAAGGNSTAAGIIRSTITQADPSTLKGDLSFFTNSGDSITEKMRIDSAGNVGIGTTSPSQLLSVGSNGYFTVDVSGNVVMASGAKITMPNGDGTKIVLNGPSSSDAITKSTGNVLNLISAGPLTFQTNGANEKVRIQSDGNVGIGTTGPTERLQVAGALAVTGTTGSYASASNIGMLDYTVSSGARVLSFGADTSTRGKITFYQSGANNILNNVPLSVDTSGNVSLVQSTGNVGIGTTGPGATLHVVSVNEPVANLSSIRIDDSTAMAAGVGGSIGLGYKYTTGGAYGMFAGIAANKINGTSGNYDTGLTFYVTANGQGSLQTRAMDINQLGNVGIGTTGPTAKLQVLTNTNKSATIDEFTHSSLTAVAPSDYSTGGVAFGFSRPSDGVLVHYIGSYNTAADAKSNLAIKSRSDIVFLNGTTDATESMRILSTGNVGIGTTGPAAKLHAFYSTADFGGVDATVLRLQGQDTVNLSENEGIGMDFVLSEGATDYTSGKIMVARRGGADNRSSMSFYTNLDGTLTEGMRLSYQGGLSLGSTYVGTNPGIGNMIIQGNVGIGTTAPGSPLQVNANASNDTEALTITNTSATGGAGLILNRTANYRAARIQFSTNGTADWYAGILRNAGGATTALHFGTGTDVAITAPVMSLLTTGNVGIGTTTPVYNLQVGPASGNAIVDVNSVAASIAEFSLSKGGTQKWQMYVPGSSNDLRFYDSADRVTLQAGGNVGIGTTAPGAPLEVKGTGTGATIAKFTDVNTTGCTLATGGTISCSSDFRLKKNIENINYGLSTVMQLRPVLYNWNYETDGQTKSLGFIAQEVEALIPKLVATDDQGMKSLNTTGIIPILTKGIQELDLKITDLTDLNDLSKGNTLRDNLVAWFSNVENKITRIFTGEVCLTDPGQDPVCLNRTELQSLKTLLQNQGAALPQSGSAGSPQAPQNLPVPEPDSTGSTPLTTSDSPQATPNTPVCTDPQILVNNVCVDPTPDVNTPPQAAPAPEGEVTPTP